MSYNISLAVELSRIIRWYDLVILSGVFILVLSAFIITGYTTASDIFNAFTISLIVCGLMYLLAGLLEEAGVSSKVPKYGNLDGIIV